MLLEQEHAVEAGHQQHVARLAARVVAADALAQEEQHAERRAVDVVDRRQIDDPRPRLARQELLKLLDHAEVEPSGDLERDGVLLLDDGDHDASARPPARVRTSSSVSWATSPDLQAA